MPDSKDKLRVLSGILRDLPPFALSVSGGLDSRFLCRAAMRCGLSPLLIFVRGPQLTPRETAGALDWVKAQELESVALDFDPLDQPEVASNTDLRCYHCKRRMFVAIRDLAASRGFGLVIEGGNASDLKQYRPGLVALRELGVRSPLAEAGLSKAEIRRLAEGIALDRPDQPSRACLLTRFAYGLKANHDTLARLGRIEDALANLGFREYRLRLPGPGEHLLHMASSEAERWREHEENIIKIMKNEGVVAFEHRFDPNISGFFDMKKSVQG